LLVNAGGGTVAPIEIQRRLSPILCAELPPAKWLEPPPVQTTFPLLFLHMADQLWFLLIYQN